MTHFNFRTHGGTQHVDIVAYAREKIKEHPDLRIYVGTDSQDKRRSTVYATVIAFRYGTRGVHYVFHKEKVRRIRDRWTRLWKEAEMTAEVALYLRNNLIPVYSVELDYSSNKKWGSHNMVQAGVGYLKGLGFNNIHAKPNTPEEALDEELQVAVKAADNIVGKR